MIPNQRNEGSKLLVMGVCRVLDGVALALALVLYQSMKEAVVTAMDGYHFFCESSGAANGTMNAVPHLIASILAEQ